MPLPVTKLLHPSFHMIKYLPSTATDHHSQSAMTLSVTTILLSCFHMIKYNYRSLCVPHFPECTPPCKNWELELILRGYKLYLWRIKQHFEMIHIYIVKPSFEIIILYAHFAQSQQAPYTDIAFACPNNNTYCNMFYTRLIVMSLGHKLIKIKLMWNVRFFNCLLFVLHTKPFKT